MTQSKEGIKISPWVFDNVIAKAFCEFQLTL